MDAKTLQMLRAVWNEYLAKRENASGIWRMNQVGFLGENMGPVLDEVDRLRKIEYIALHLVAYWDRHVQDFQQGKANDYLTQLKAALEA